MMATQTRGLPLPHLRSWRIRRFMSQLELADKAGVSKSTMNRAEAGEEAISFANIRKIAEALGIKPDDLLREPRAGE